jgi:hypothetical protein
MGDFRIEVNATGGHGCQRDVKDGGIVAGCGQPTCPDCIAREFVAKLKDSGAMVKDALLIHWPNSQPTIVDNLVTRMRGGSF